ncbi:ribbon-helix-helix domain-containing protein [Acetobacter orientalis]|uniref:ribbon-helix-helix domain-containing protein n=1 Tax=Acetobacter orientalis TaxID=146474 RepID=UPI0039E99D8E
MPIDSAKKPKKGRPKVDTEAVNVRLERIVLDDIDAWIATNGPPYVSRPEAIRRLVQLGLKRPASSL